MNNTRSWLRSVALLLPLAASCAPVDEPAAPSVDELRLQSYDLCSLFGASALQAAVAGAQVDEIGPLWVEPGTATILRGRHLDRLPTMMRAAYYSGATRITTSTRVFPMGPNAILVMAPRNIPAAGANVSIRLEYTRLCREDRLGSLGLGGSLAVYAERSLTVAASPATASFHWPRFFARTSGVMPAPALTARTVSANEVALTWTDPGFDEIGYRIDYRQAGSPEWLAVGTVPANRTSEPVRGFQHATGYEFRVVPFDYDRDGAPSNAAAATTAALRVNSAAVTVHRSFSSAGGVAPLAGTTVQPASRAAVAWYDANANRVVDGMPGGATAYPFTLGAFPSWPLHGSVEGNRFDAGANLVVMVEFAPTAGGITTQPVSQFVALHLQVGGGVAALRSAVGGDYARGQGARITTLVPTLSDRVQLLEFRAPANGVNGRVRGSVRANLMMMTEQLSLQPPQTSTQHLSDVSVDFDLEVLPR